MTKLTVELSEGIAKQIDFILSVTDTSDAREMRALSIEDVVSIGVILFKAASMTDLMVRPAQEVWAICSHGYLEQGADNGPDDVG